MEQFHKNERSFWRCLVPSTTREERKKIVETWIVKQFENEIIACTAHTPDTDVNNDEKCVSFSFSFWCVSSINFTMDVVMCISIQKNHLKFNEGSVINKKEMRLYISSTHFISF